MRIIHRASLIFTLIFLPFGYVGVGQAIADSMKLRHERHCPGQRHGPAWMEGYMRPMTIVIWPFYIPILGIEVVYEPGRVCDRFD